MLREARRQLLPLNNRFIWFRISPRINLIQRHYRIFRIWHQWHGRFRSTQQSKKAKFFKCSDCGTLIKYGYTMCSNCKARVIEGVTDHERHEETTISIYLDV